MNAKKIEPFKRPDADPNAAPETEEGVGRSEVIILMGLFSGSGVILGLVLGWIMWHH